MKNRFFLVWCALGALIFFPGHVAPVLAQNTGLQQETWVHPKTYKPIAKLWNRQAKQHNVSGKRTWLGPISGNGTKDRKHKAGYRHTLIHVPDRWVPTKPTELLIWLHGHNGFNKFGIRILRHLDARFNRGDNVIVVAVEQPWSHWTRTRTSRNGTGPFRKPGEFEEWMPQVLNILGSYGVPVQEILSKDITLYGHSAGGSGIKSMSKSGALQILRPGKIVFSDSTYGRWFDVVYDKYIKHNPGTKVFVLTKKWQAPYMSMRRFFKERKSVAGNVLHVALSKGWSHKRIGDNCLLYPEKPF